MPLKNYTTEVSSMKSIGEIQGKLVAHGATDILIHYTPDREPENMSFIIKTTQGDVPFRLPANVKAVATLLLKQLTKSNYRQWDTQYQKERQQKALAQASRVAWRIIKDWIDAQVAIIETEMVTIEEVFLPYMEVKNGRTLYELMQERRFLLTEGKEQ
jgi:hypothetical protein